MAPRGESTSRIWVALLHFITWIPLGWLASHAGEMFDNMRVNPIPANIDHGSVLYKGLGLVTVAVSPKSVVSLGGSSVNN